MIPLKDNAICMQTWLETTRRSATRRSVTHHPSSPATTSSIIRSCGCKFIHWSSTQGTQDTFWHHSRQSEKKTLLLYSECGPLRASRAALDAGAKEEVQRRIIMLQLQSMESNWVGELVPKINFPPDHCLPLPVYLHIVKRHYRRKRR